MNKGNIEINFPLPSSIQEIIEILTNVNIEQDYCYFYYVEALYCTAKEIDVRGKLTKKQWDTLSAK